MEHPGNLKPLADSFLCAGYNQLTTICYDSQPFDEKPGYRLYGSHFNRSNTWWPVVRPFFLSIGRVQTMMQQSRGVADLLLVESETPLSNYMKFGRIDALPKQFLYDACGSQELPKLKVEGGEIVSPLGKRYKRMLFLVPDVTIAGALDRISPEVLAELDRLAAVGVRIYSNAKQPTGSPSLAGYPESNAKSAALGEKLWGGGKVLPIEKIGEGLDPDISGHGELNWTHRRTDKMDAYFLANHATASVTQEVSFRVSGRHPQLWHTETGTMEPVLVWREEGGRTVVPLQFDPLESYFVLFDGDAPPTPQWTKREGPDGGKLSTLGSKPMLRTSQGGKWRLVRPDGTALDVEAAAPPAPISVAGPWTLSYPPGQDTPDTLVLDKLQSMIEHANPMVRGYSGTVTYRTQFSVPAGTKAADLAFLLDLGNVQQVAAVKLNGKDLGIAYRQPYVLAAGDALKEGENELEIQVTNTWLNRMVAQKDLPEEKRLGDPSSWMNDEKIARTFGYKPLAEKGYLMDSGLIGPVVLRAERVVPVAGR